MTFTEHFNGDKLAYILAHWDELGRSGRDTDEEQRGAFDHPRDKLMRFLARSRDMLVEVQYFQSSGRGRWFAKDSVSLQNLSRPLRHTAALGLYKDMDIVNCNPTILLHLCGKLGIKCPRLREYVRRRKDLLAALGCTREQAKKAYLSLLNGGVKAFCEVPNKTKHLKEFKHEAEMIRREFAKRYPDLLEQVKARRIRKGKLTNHEAGLLSRLIEDKENEIITAVWQFFGSPRDCVLCFDGIMLRADKDYDLRACERHVQQQLGISVQLKCKDFDEAIDLEGGSGGGGGGGGDHGECSREEGLYAEYMQHNKRKRPFDIRHFKKLLKRCDNDGTVVSTRTRTRTRTRETAQHSTIGNQQEQEQKQQKRYQKALQAALEYLNDYLLIVKGTDVTYVHVDYDDAEGREVNRVFYASKRALIENWDEYEVVNKAVSKRPIKIITCWLMYEWRRNYHEIVFHPNVVYPYIVNRRNTYNLWTGWVHVYDANFVVDEARIKRIVFHLREIICAGSETLYSHVLKLWKLMLLGKKSAVALGWSGLQGTGKNVMIEYIGQMIVGDEYYVYIACLEDLTSRFSSLRCNKCLVVCDELDTWKGDHKTANLLKGLITQSKTKLERKGKDACLHNR